MRKIIAAINLSLDGFCDHTILLPDEEVHRHYQELLNEAEAILYGRTTYQLMEFWRPLLENPPQEKSMYDFALAIDKIPKIVFSHTLHHAAWKSARLADRTLADEVLALKQQPGKNILIGSRSLIIQLMNLNLLDEYQLCIHPVVAGGGLPLFENINHRTILKLTKTKSLNGGAVILYYKPANKEQ